MTIKDIALKAGVSATTVSRFLNGRGKMSAETAQRIERIIDQHNYRPNLLGRALKVSTTRTLGVIVPSLENPVFAEIIAGIQQRARHFNYILMILDTGYQSSRELEAVNTLLQHQVQGILLTVTSTLQNASLTLLNDEKVPHCLIHNPELKGHDSVHVDNIYAGGVAARKLLQLGHHRMGILSTPFEHSDRAQQRVAGFQNALSEAGVATADVYPIHTSDTNNLVDELTEHLPVKSRATAWFCTNDLLAIGLIKVLKGRGLNVPEDQSVIGFDGMAIGQMLTPSLASIRVPHRDMGQIGVDALLNRLQGSGLSGSYVLPCDYLFQGTIACPPDVTTKHVTETARQITEIL